jgi:chromosome segregation ATPase
VKDYEVTLLIDATIGMTVKANSPEEAAEKAEEKADFRSLCHQCSKELQTGDCYGAYVYADGEQVGDTTRAGELTKQNTKLSDLVKEYQERFTDLSIECNRQNQRIAELEAQLEQCQQAKSPVHLYGGTQS